MGEDGVSDVSAGDGERVGGMANGTGFTSGSISRSEPMVGDVKQVVRVWGGGRG